LKGEIGQYPPIHEVLVPHNHRLAHEQSAIPIFHQLPAGASEENPVPAVIILTGLDGYRTELAVWAEGWRRNNVAFICMEIPGTGDCPADAKDPTSPDRLFTSLLEWIDAQEAIDTKKLCVWAFSTGGYYAIRLAHTHPDRFAGVIALGGGCHYMFDPKWLNEVNHLEYPFECVLDPSLEVEESDISSLANTLAYKWGYGDDVESFKREASDRFSLLKDGTLKKPKCARLLLVNVCCLKTVYNFTHNAVQGTEDEVFPIDDYYLALQHGAPKEARWVANFQL
jgi:pimeloyl-ACP methyl ester carboxylesterase